MEHTQKHTKNSRCRWKHTHTLKAHKHTNESTKFLDRQRNRFEKKTHSLSPTFSRHSWFKTMAQALASPECMALPITIATMICKTPLEGREEFWARIPVVGSSFENFVNKENLKYSQLRRVIHSRLFVRSLTQKKVWVLKANHFSFPFAWESNTYRIWIFLKRSIQRNIPLPVPYIQNVKGKGRQIKAFLMEKLRFNGNWIGDGQIQFQFISFFLSSPRKDAHFGAIRFGQTSVEMVAT